MVNGKGNLGISRTLDCTVRDNLFQVVFQVKLNITYTYKTISVQESNLNRLNFTLFGRNGVCRILDTIKGHLRNELFNLKLSCYCARNSYLWV